MRPRSVDTLISLQQAKQRATFYQVPYVTRHCVAPCVQVLVSVWGRSLLLTLSGSYGLRLLQTNPLGQLLLLP
jgi:hypothetical protein